jgi:hypothetical protein
VAAAVAVAVEAAAVVGSPGVVPLLPEASVAARVVLPAVVAPVSEARQGRVAVPPAPGARQGQAVVSPAPGQAVVAPASGARQG